MSQENETFDAIVIGTGFGGAVTACRLAQGGLRICVLERGRRYESTEPIAGEEPQSDFPQLPATDRVAPDLARWRWAADQGLWDMRDLGGAHVVQAAGYGGGSLIYANVHLRAPDDVFTGGRWPSAYTSAALAPYYDRVAAMLDAKPITEAPYSLIKTDQLKRAASALGREADFFHPPLAINFKEGENAFGKRQGACRACGECDTGCRYRAKNTLDLNYLAVVDDAPNAEVRTQAEALHISEKSAGAAGYTVTYRDHLQGREIVRIQAPHVFVCAGAANSTALLLHSKRVGHAGAAQEDRGLPRLDPHNLIGKQFCLNADSLGMVYDAKLGAGAAQEPRVIKPTMGPVITGTLVHRDPRDGTWFLIQDGGFPKALARHVGLMRAPVLARRNRFASENTVNVVVGPTLPSALPHPLPKAVPAQTLGDAGGIPGGPLLSPIDGLLRLVDGGELGRSLPPQLRQSLRALGKELNALRNDEVRAFAIQVRDRLAEEAARNWARGLTLWLAKEPPEALLKLTRPLLLWLYGVAAPPAKLDVALEQVIDERYDAKTPVKLVTKIMRWMLGFDDEHEAHSEHCMVLLGMGRDDAHATLTLDAHGDLHAEVTLPPRGRVYSQQERLMRDVAAALSGKLRVNPFWAFNARPVTVHGQGGCRMSDNEKHGVTDTHGQVFGHPGLFVMDGSLFPASVGVNPSATIAAIAERNIAWFLREVVKDRAKSDWVDVENARATTWAARAKQAGWQVTPATREGVVPVVSEPIGVEFREEMSGFHSAPDSEVLASEPPDDDAYDAAEIHGRPTQSVSVVLDVRVRDIAEFMRDKRHTAEVTGTADVTGPVLRGHYEVLGAIELFSDHTDPRVNRMRYHLRLRSAGALVATLEGYKRIRNDPGPDAWRDTTTLFFTLKSAQGETISHGAMHVAMNRFFFAQLPSFRVLGTEDPARVAWAVTTFAGYFFGSLQRVYVPQLRKMVDLLDAIELR